MMRVRPGLPGDAEDLSYAWAGAWRQAYAGIYPDEALDGLDVREWAQTWRRTVLGPDKARYVAVDVSGEHRLPVGYVVAGPDRFGDGVGDAEHPRDRDPHPDTGELLSLYVAPSHWGTGTADLLIAEAMTWLTSRHQHVVLWVLRDNPRARAFYARHGWTPDGATQAREILGHRAPEVRLRLR